MDNQERDSTCHSRKGFKTFYQDKISNYYLMYQRLKVNILRLDSRFNSMPLNCSYKICQELEFEVMSSSTDQTKNSTSLGTCSKKWCQKHFRECRFYTIVQIRQLISYASKFMVDKWKETDTMGTGHTFKQHMINNKLMLTILTCRDKRHPSLHDYAHLRNRCSKTRSHEAQPLNAKA